MLSFLRKNKLLHFIIVFVSIQSLYFSIYTFILYHKLSWLHLAFITVFMSSYAILLYGYKNYLWHVCLYILLATIYFWSLFNFVHFKVFGSFLSISFSQITTFQGGIKDLIVGFATLVPWYLYILTVLFLIISVGFAYYNVKKHKYNLLDSFEFVKKYSFKDRVRIILGYVMLLTIINFSGICLLSYFEKNPRQNWWSLRNQIIDYGIVGHTYAKISGFFGKGSPVFASDNPYLVNDENLHLTNLEKVQKMRELEKGIISESSVRSEILSSVKDVDHLNFLMVQLESVGSWAVQNDPSPMPFLRSLMEDNITVNEFYPNSCETINAEFSANCSFLPNSHEPISFSHKNNHYTCLPEILSKEHGFFTKYYHANLASFWDRDILTPALGFDDANFVPHYKQKAYDQVVFTDAINELSGQENPFYAYITSFTTHSPHNQEMYEYYNSRYGEIIKKFKDPINPDLSAGVELSDDEIRDYFAFLTATDNALRQMFEQLQAKGLHKNTVVFIYNDHRFYNFKERDSFEQTFYRYNKSPFVMVVPKNIQTQVAQYASHIDIAPTVLHMIEQDKYEPRSQFIGESLLASQRHDEVLNKCLGNIFYINKNILVTGNYSTQQYFAVPLQKEHSAEYVLKWKMYPHYYATVTDAILYHDEL